MELPFIGPSYHLESRPSGVQRTINMVPVPEEPGNERTAWVFKDVPGLVVFNEPAPPPPPPSDPYYDFVILLLHFNEWPLVDNSQYEESPTVATGVSLVSSPSLFSEMCLKTVNDDSGWLNYSAVQYGLSLGVPGCVEFFFYHVATANVVTSPIYVYWSASPSEYYNCGNEGNVSQVYLDLSDFGAPSLGPFTSTSNAWHHVAYTINESGTVTLYLDGASVGSIGSALSGVATNGSVIIGSVPNAAGVPGRLCDAYIAELRITRGVIRYSGAFTPPTEPFPNSGPP